MENGVAGKAPDGHLHDKGLKPAHGVTMAQMTGGLTGSALVLAGPTLDYGYTSFGSDVTTQGYVSENPVPTAKCAADGTCTYTFTHLIPAKATGTFSIGASKDAAKLPCCGGTTQQVDHRIRRHE